MRYIARILAAIILVGTSGWAASAYPKPQGRVSDYAGVLDASSKVQLEKIIHEVDQKTGAEIAVVCIPSLDGASIEEYAAGLFKAWGIGKKGKNNGVLLLVALNDRKMRIEVGYGLEPILPDGLAGDIIRNQLRPAFKAGDYAGGIKAGLQRIAGIVVAGQVVTDEERQRLYAPPDERIPISMPMMIGILSFIGCFVAVGAFLMGAGLGARVGILVVFGLGWAILSGLMVLAFPLPHFVLPLWGLAMVGLGFRKGRASPKFFRSGSSQGSGAINWKWGATGSSGSGGSSGSDSSFGSSDDSFGGGSSGGGGASGDW